MTTSTKYVIWNNFSNEISTTFSILNEATEYDIDANEEVYEVVSTDCDFSYEDYNSDGQFTAIATISATINGISEQATFDIQMCDGVYLPQMGCWITTGNGDGKYSKTEAILFEAHCDLITKAQSYIKKVINDKYKYHECDFGCTINNTSLQIKENTRDDSCILVAKNEDFNINDYATKYTEYDVIFDSLEEAEDYIKSFKTTENNDFEGLQSIFNELSI